MENSNFSGVNIDLNCFPNSFLDNFEKDNVPFKLNESHPIHDIDYNHLKKTTIEENNRIAKCFGSQQSLKNSIERNMCSQSTRLPGITSSMLSLEILMDKLDTLESFDYMNTEKPTNEFGIGGIHSHIEDKMNI
uniref:Proteasome maturation factor UMP1, putative n=1 Tax=Theileria annulata TaxID=5874 RepID=A0A3B0N687_THEAN